MSHKDQKVGIFGIVGKRSKSWNSCTERWHLFRFKDHNDFGHSIPIQTRFSKNHKYLEHFDLQIDRTKKKIKADILMK